MSNLAKHPKHLYLTQLVLNPKSAQAIQDIANIYKLHARISTAFLKKTTEHPTCLWRSEINTSIRILVQSHTKPDWTKIRVTNYFSSIAEKVFELDQLALHNQYQFRLRANATFKTNGKRVAIKDEQKQFQWLFQHAEKGGFKILDASRTHNLAIVARKADAKITLNSVEWDGVLEVCDLQLFLQTLSLGIGPAKGFGFGLLSLA